MLAKKTSKNQVTLPKAVVAHFPSVEYFEVTTDGQSILLLPFERSRAGDVRPHLVQLGHSDLAVTDAVAWARDNK